MRDIRIHEVVEPVKKIGQDRVSTFDDQRWAGWGLNLRARIKSFQYPSPRKYSSQLGRAI